MDVIRELQIRRLGLVPYEEALQLQKSLVEERKAGRIPDQLLLLQHPPVITLGVKARSDRSHVLASESELESQGVEFFESAFDASNPRKGGKFDLVPTDHDVTDEHAAYKLADAAWPGYFGIFYKNDKRPTKNANEAKINKGSQEKVAGLKDWQILQKTFDRLK
jgi:hypothetical protein